MHPAFSIGFGLVHLFFFLFPHSLWAKEKEKQVVLPASALVALSELPGGALTTEYVVQRAITSTDSYRVVQSYLTDRDSLLLKASAPLDFRLTGSAYVLRDRNEAGSPFSTSRFDQSRFSLGVSKLFVTGTEATLETFQTSNDLSFSSTSINYKETDASLKLSQNLLKNSFGAATRHGLDSAEWAGQARVLEVRSQVESWSIGILQMFYESWLAQTEQKAAREGVKRRERLLEVVQARRRRGVTEEPDYLQVRSAVLQSTNEEARASQLLKDRWRSLILTLKLPREWTEIDPSLVPLVLDSPVEEAQRTCQARQRDPVGTASATQARELQLKAANSGFDQARLEDLPDLKLQAEMSTNGVDSNASRAWNETLDVNHPAWSVGLVFQMPLQSRLEEANRLEALAARQRAEASHSQAVEEEKLAWLSDCSTLDRLTLTYSNALTVHELQQKRAQEENQRFGLGRASVFQVIQAEDDATEAELRLRSLEVERRLKAWSVLKLSGSLSRWLARMESASTGGIGP